MNLQPTLEDELVFIRPLTKEDYDNLWAAISDPLIFEQHHNAQARATPAGFKIFFSESIVSGGALAVIDRKTNKIIGSSRFQRLPETDKAIELGWTFLQRAYWGGTYNGAVKKLLIDYAHQYYEDVFLVIAADNMRSQGAAKKVGGVLLTDYDPPTAIKTAERDNKVTYCIRRNSA